MTAGSIQDQLRPRSPPISYETPAAASTNDELRGLVISTLTRDGAPPIDLIDGDALCELLKKNGRGPKTRRVEAVQVNPELFLLGFLDGL